MTLDAAVYLGAWPFRALEGTTRGLSRLMQQHGIGRAVVSPLDGLFHDDPDAANRRLLRQIRGRSTLHAAPIVNLRLADWRQRIDRLATLPQVKAIRLAPTFHGYPVPQMREAGERAAAHGLSAAVQLRMSDERFHPVFLDLPAASLEELAALAAETPDVRWVASAARTHDTTPLADRLRPLPNLWLDTSHIDGLDCIRRVCDTVGAGRLLFSTCWPFFYARSGVLKMEEADLTAEERAALLSGNAAKAFGLDGPT